jgi:hypothetical protein
VSWAEAQVYMAQLQGCKFDGPQGSICPDILSSVTSPIYNQRALGQTHFCGRVFSKTITQPDMVGTPVISSLEAGGW